MGSKMTVAQEIAQAKRKRKFGRAVAAGHAMRRAAAEADLRSRNAYRAAIGLPLITKVSQ